MAPQMLLLFCLLLQTMQGPAKQQNKHFYNKHMTSAYKELDLVSVNVKQLKTMNQLSYKEQ